jgi:hypothetical protein
MITESLNTAIGNAFSSVADDVTKLVTTSAPYALSIIGLVLAVTIGIKVFKKLTAQA